MQVLGKTKKDVVTEFRTAEILEAARKVFAEKGFSGSRVDDIAARARVAKGTVYLYYPSKREIYWAALRLGIMALHEETARRMSAASTVEEKIRAFIALRMTYFDENRDFFKIYFSEMGNALTHPAYVNKQFKELYIEGAKTLEPILEDAMKKGAIRTVRPDAASFGIFELTRAMVVQRVMGWSQASVEEDTEFVFDLVWKGIVKR